MFTLWLTQVSCLQLHPAYGLRPVAQVVEPCALNLEVTGSISADKSKQVVLYI